MVRHQILKAHDRLVRTTRAGSQYACVVENCMGANPRTTPMYVLFRDVNVPYEFPAASHGPWMSLMNRPQLNKAVDNDQSPN
jgi:hypothetical protein